MEGITVDAMSVGEEQAFRSSGRATTDREGSYSLQLVPGTYSIAPREDFEDERSLREPEPALVRVEADLERGAVDFTLQTSGGIAGLVRRQDGGPLEGILVTARSWPEASVSGSTSCRDTRFLLPLEDGQHWISVVGSDGERCFGTPEPVFVEVGPGRVQTLDLRLVACARVAVRLTDADGELSGILVELEAIDAQGRAVLSTKPARDERELLLVPGQYTLRARHEGRLLEQGLTLTSSETRRELEFRLD
jgi:hypothetical protein